MEKYVRNYANGEKKCRKFIYDKKNHLFKIIYIFCKFIFCYNEISSSKNREDKKSAWNLRSVSIQYNSNTRLLFVAHHVYKCSIKFVHRIYFMLSDMKLRSFYIYINVSLDAIYFVVIPVLAIHTHKPINTYISIYNIQRGIDCKSCTIWVIAHRKLSAWLQAGLPIYPRINII